jgi:hypothetical protein
MILISIQAATSAIILALAGSSGRNMLQTYRVRNNLPVNSDSICFPEIIGPSASVEHLQTMKRKQLIELFSASKVPSDLSEVEGEWDGFLLDNGILMTSVSNLISHKFFSMGKRWNGKWLQRNKESLQRTKSTTQ